MNPRVLKIDGKFVTVRDYGERFKLCAVDTQPNDYTVNIWKHSTQMTWIAFEFKRMQDSTPTFYTLQAKDDSVEVVKVDQVDGDQQDMWFEKIGYSEKYNVRTARHPHRYLCVDEQSREPLFFLSDKEDARAEVKDEAR